MCTYTYIYIYTEYMHICIYIYIHTHIIGYYSAIKEEWHNTIWSNMEGPRDCHAKWNKSEKDKYHMIYFIGRILNYNTNELYKAEIDLQT